MIELGIRYDDILLQDFGDRNPYTKKIERTPREATGAERKVLVDLLYSSTELGAEEFEKLVVKEFKSYKETLLRILLEVHASFSENPELSAKKAEEDFLEILSKNEEDSLKKVVGVLFTPKGEPRKIGKSDAKEALDSSLHSLLRGAGRILTAKDSISKFTATGVVLRLLGYESPLKILLSKDYSDKLPMQIFSSIKIRNYEESRVGASPSFKEARRDGKKRIPLKSYLSFLSASPYTESKERAKKFSRMGGADALFKPLEYKESKCEYFGLFLEEPEVIVEAVGNLLRGKVVKEFPSITYNKLKKEFKGSELKVDEKKQETVDRKKALQKEVDSLYKEFGSVIDPEGLLILENTSWLYAYLFYSLNNSKKILSYQKKGRNVILVDEAGNTVSFGGVTAHYTKGSGKGILQEKELGKVVSGSKLTMPQLGTARPVFLASGCLVINFEGDKELMEEIKNSPVSDLVVLNKGTAYLEYVEEV